MLLVHTNVMSEGLCQLFWLLAVWLLIRARESIGIIFPALAGLAAGLAILSRYGAIAAVPAGVLYLLFFQPPEKRPRILSAAVFALPALLPVGLFTAWEHLHASADLSAAGLAAVGINRNFGYYGLTSQQIIASVRAMEEWLCPVLQLPFSVRLIFMGIFGLGLVAVGTILAVNRRVYATAANDGALGLMLLNALAYLIVLGVTGLFFDPNLDLSSRMYLPAFVFVVLAVGATWPWLRESIAVHPRRRRVGQALAALLGVLLIIYGVAALGWLRQKDDEAYLGFASAHWRESAAVALIKNLPSSGPIFSNQIKVPYLYTSRTDLYSLPRRESAGDRQESNQNYARKMTDLVGILAQSHGTIVLLTADISSLKRYATVDELKSNPALQVSAETPDAVFFVAAHQ